MPFHLVERTFTDYADNIEGVNVHYALTRPGELPDWENQRLTRFMPLGADRIRRKVLRLPLCITDSASGRQLSRYLLHYYFEIFQDGDRHYSQPYLDEIDTGGASATGLRADADSQITESATQL